ncbi:hypothetical protein J7L00_02520 [Candidatus Bathyarchaeota archaeon]|nr:hypothetical protein [Candidatus Bathyarchaeota archaeon]
MCGNIVEILHMKK